MEATEILKITDPTAIFPGDEEKVKAAFRKLVKQWHPDHSDDPKSRQVFSHIMWLKDLAIEKLTGRLRPKAVDGLNNRLYETTGGKNFSFRYLKALKGDLGDILVAKNTIAYEVSKDFEDIAEAEASRLSTFSFADENMRKEILRFLPKLKEQWLTDDRIVTVLDKPSDTVVLSDLIDHFGGKIPAVHAAWIISSLQNMACYLRWSGICHGAISPTTVLVCPEYHSIILAGGWGFSTKFGQRPAALPERTTSLLPRLALKGETVNERVDLQLIRATALELMGSPGGGGLVFDKEIPAPMKEWLQLPPSDDAFSDYKSWIKCLEKSFGKRKFIPMGVTPRDIYTF